MTKKILRLLFFVFVILFMVIRYFHSEIQTTEVAISPIVCDEYEEIDSIQAIRKQHRSWLEYTYNQGFCTQYQLASSAVSNSTSFRNSLTFEDQSAEMNFWSEVYFAMYEHDRDQLMHLQDSLQHLGEKYNMDRGSFARFVVAFVQDIPYNYIAPGNCAEYTGHPCVPDVQFGILSPVEFLYSLQGDCDTRTVLLYTLLRNFGYDPLIINSREYRHSMLALDIPASGESFIYKGRTYSYWETTKIGWLPGMLPPDMNNKDYWTVALDYEFETNTAGVY
ncbi:MAG TPA: hypothetical protein VIT44_09215 [Cyclobacteriaceae bacterium]